MITQLAAHEDLRSAAAPHMTLGGYGMVVIEVLRRHITIDAQLSREDEFVTMARVRVEKSEGSFHLIDVALGDHSLLATVHDQDGHMVHDWPTLLSLAVLMKRARTHF